MVATTAKLRVTPPQYTPLPFGLLSVAALADNDPDGHWRNGVLFQPDPIDEAGITVMACPTAPDAKTPTTEGLLAIGVESFTVYAWVHCSAVSLDEAQARTTAALTNGEARAVEEEFWTGDAGTQPHLAANAEVFAANGERVQSAATTLTTSAVDVVEGVGLLEGALADCYGGIGVLHVPVRGAAEMWPFHQIDKSGRVASTRYGTQIAFGSGYPGTGPDGTLPTATPAGSKQWLYATGALKYWRSKIEVFSQPAAIVDRSNNDLVAIAERTYVIGWDRCHFAAEVQFGGVLAGAPG